MSAASAWVRRLAGIVVPFFLACATAQQEPACADGIDNDSDGLIDLLDLGCEGEADDSEDGGLFCGDGVLDTPLEACDGGNLGGLGCADLGFDQGVLLCRGDCSFDTSGCFNLNPCGNGAVDAGEDCDGANLGGNSCQGLGLGQGQVSCNADCTLNTNNCAEDPCGNGILDAGEDCDGAALNGESCPGLGFDGGTLGCNAACSFDTSSCTLDSCGNGGIDAGEACDGANLNGQSCQGLGFLGGTLSCDGSCGFNTSACTVAVCGNNNQEGTETCDGSDLNGQSCTGLGFAGGGTLACNASCSGFVTTGCTNVVCGNGVREAGEACDGGDLNGQSCASLGFGGGGTLACNAACSGFVTTGCAVATQCNDTTDNDADGFTDASDPGCSNSADNSEEIFADTCNGLGGPILDLTLANTTATILEAGSTVGQGSNFAPTDLTECTTNSSGEDIFFLRVIGATRNLRITTDRVGTNFDTVLYVRQASCNAPQAELCDDDVSGTNLKSTLELTMPVADYFIFVDGFGTATGSYELLIEPL